MATVEERLHEHDVILAEVQAQLAQLLQGQSNAAELIERRADQAAAVVREEAETQRAAIQRAAEDAKRDIGDVNAAVVKVSTGLLTLQQQVTKWAAAGSLAGAVVLFIAVRALGF